MLPALSLKPSFGVTGFAEPDNQWSAVQLWWHTPTFYAVCYLHANGRVSGSHLWIDDVDLAIDCGRNAA